MGNIEYRNPYAELEKPDSGILVTAKKAGGSEKFYCPHSNCLDPQRRLFRKQSVNEHYFFCHYGDYEHPINFETLLHKLTIRHFKDLGEFELPILNGRTYKIDLNPESTILEYKGLKNIKPDVRVVSNKGDEFYIEIFVTHETKGEKLSIIGEYKTPTLEIDLNRFYKANFELCKSDLEFIKSSIPKLISDSKLKNWLYHPALVSAEPTLPVVVEPEVKTQTKPSELTTGEKFVIGLGIGTLVMMLSPSIRKRVFSFFNFLVMRK